MTEDRTPRIYVACLSAYCNGKLHGAWIDCNQDADAIAAEIKEMLSHSPEPDAEEWAIHSHENWQRIEIGEHEDIERLAELAQMLAEHGAAFGAYCQYYGSDATEEDFKDCYMGQYESEEDFVRDRWDDEGKLSQLEAIGISEHYIDWEAIARDWFIDSYHSVDAGYKKVYVFSRY
jgi:antirestriction protein